MSKQKRKGDGYERELAKWLDANLFDSVGQITRTPLSGGGSHVDGAGKADLQGTPTVWVEAKRTEKFSPYAAMEQAERGIKASRSDEMPVVMQRRNGMTTESSMVVMRLGDWAALYSSWLSDCGYRVTDPEEVLSQVLAQEEYMPRHAADDRGDNVVRLLPQNGVLNGEDEDS
tara:strand:- start:4089 stop:4607 length:519 start_codon:yes stop_codon:yes gene_type:complete